MHLVINHTQTYINNSYNRATTRNTGSHNISPMRITIGAETDAAEKVQPVSDPVPDDERNAYLSEAIENFRLLIQKEMESMNEYINSAKPSMSTLCTMLQLEGKVTDVNSWLQRHRDTDTAQVSDDEVTRSVLAGQVSSDIEQSGIRPLASPHDAIHIGRIPEQSVDTLPARSSPLDAALESARPSVACEVPISSEQKWSPRFKNLFKNPIRRSPRS
jgi:hypothetical protein